MDRYCNSTFWDSRITWETTDPDFTECFEKTVLLWSACTFLWITGIFDIYTRSDPDRGSSALGHGLTSWRPAWTWLTIFKLQIIGVLITLEIVALFIILYQHSGRVPDVVWTTPIVLITTHFLSASLIVFHKSRCVHTSGFQLLHWLMLTIVHGLIFRTEYKMYSNSNPSISFPSLLLLGLALTLMTIQLLVFCWPDIPPDRNGEYTRLIPCSDGIEREECPMIRCSCISYILFSWCTPLVRKGYAQPLTSKDLWDLLPSLTSRVVFKLFQKSYGKPLFGETRSVFKNIIKPMWNTCGWSLIVAAACKQIGGLMSFVPPYLMGYVIDFVENKEIETWKGCLWAVLLLLTYLVITCLWEMFYLHIFKCNSNILTCLNMIIYQKSIRVSSAARKTTTTGEVVNLMSVDVESIRLVLYKADALWSFPLQITLGITLIWRELGYAVFPGLGVICAMIPITWLFSSKMSKYRKAQMKKKDERIRVISEVLSGIQVVKLYAWEPSFIQQIRKIREEEIGLLRKRTFCNCLMSFVLGSGPFLVSVAAFFTYVFASGGVLQPKKAFTSLILFNLITDPIQNFPLVISAIVDARVSFKRVNNFLNAEENHPEATKFITKMDCEGENAPAVEIVNGTFAWEETAENAWKLEHINLEIETSSLTAIVGKVASGKSSLLSAMLGDMRKMSGQVTIRGKVAYAPQVPWILNATLRENICFGLPYDQDKYTTVLECCCLVHDIDILPAGDLTEIGEKGINLSGGQKQRISLARAAYSEADVLILDDVLSAVDSHVGKHIFNRLLGPSGFLKEKTRILCTHAYQYLSQMDCIVILEEGRIVESGSYDELMATSDRFSHLMSSHIQSKEFDNNASDLSSSTAKNSTQLIDARKMEQGKLIEEEKLETGDVKASIFIAYVKALGYPLLLAFVLFFGCSEGLSLARNVVLSKWTDVSNRGNATGVIITSYTLEYTFLGISQSFCYLLGFLILAIASLRAAQVIHNRMLQRILLAPMSFFNVTPLGRITNRFSSDVASVDEELPSCLGDWVCHIFKFLGVMAAVMYATNVYFLLYMIPLTLMYYVHQRYYIACMQQIQRIANSLRSPIYAQFQESLHGTSTLRAYKANERFSQLLGDKIDNYNRAMLPHLIIRRWLSIRLGFLGSTVVFLPGLFAVIWRNTMSPSLVGLSISYSLLITDIVSWLVKVTSYLQYEFVSMERIVEYSNVDQEADFDNGRKDCSPKWPEIGAISFDNYETRYRPGLDLVLKHFTCTIASGEKIGVVGRTGAGKSSLTLAIFRIIEAAQGKILIDGVNIADLGLHQVRKRLTVIPQDPVLFSRSLRLNLDPFAEHGDDMIWKALEMAHLKTYLEELGEGLDFLVAEGGENLSVGQRQLVCLARAILRKSTILILDEATASVDSVTDELIQATIRAHFADCTILNVAHRLNTVLDSTRVLVLDRGEISEFDTPKNLLANPQSHFYGMAKDAGIV